MATSSAPHASSTCNSPAAPAARSAWTALSGPPGLRLSHAKGTSRLRGGVRGPSETAYEKRASLRCSAVSKQSQSSEPAFPSQAAACGASRNVVTASWTAWSRSSAVTGNRSPPADRGMARNHSVSAGSHVPHGTGRERAPARGITARHRLSRQLAVTAATGTQRAMVAVKTDRGNRLPPRFRSVRACP